jgi:chromosome segregation ATPase
MDKASASASQALGNTEQDEHSDMWNATNRLTNVTKLALEDETKKLANTNKELLRVRAEKDKLLQELKVANGLSAGQRNRLVQINEEIQKKTAEVRTKEQELSALEDTVNQQMEKKATLEGKEKALGRFVHNTQKHLSKRRQEVIRRLKQARDENEEDVNRLHLRVKDIRNNTLLKMKEFERARQDAEQELEYKQQETDRYIHAMRQKMKELENNVQRARDLLEEKKKECLPEVAQAIVDKWGGEQPRDDVTVQQLRDMVLKTTQSNQELQSKIKVKNDRILRLVALLSRFQGQCPFPDDGDAEEKEDVQVRQEESGSVILMGIYSVALVTSGLAVWLK